jgi:hypothetical protein
VIKCELVAPSELIRQRYLAAGCIENVDCSHHFEFPCRNHPGLIVFMVKASIVPAFDPERKNICNIY